MLGDYSYITHVESLIEVLKSGHNVFAMPIDRGVDLDEDTDLAHVVTVHDASSRRCPTVSVRYAEGCSINDDDRSGFAAAVEAAAASDVAVLVMGERSGLTDDCTTGESRDVASLRLTGVQEELVHAVAATGTPVVLVLVAGRPVGSPAVHAAAGAVLMAWLPGEQGGPAIADVLDRRGEPRRQAADQLPADVGSDPRLLRSQGLRRPIALEGLATSTSRTNRCTRSGTASATPRSRSRPRVPSRPRSLSTTRSRSRRSSRNTGERDGRRGRAAVRTRPDGIDHPTGTRTDRIRPGDARGRDLRPCHVPGARGRARLLRSRPHLRGRAGDIEFFVGSSSD